MFKTHSSWRPFFLGKGFKGFFGILVKEDNFILKPSQKQKKIAF
jgi:hypothetical protein